MAVIKVKNTNDEWVVVAVANQIEQGGFTEEDLTFTGNCDYTFGSPAFIKLVVEPNMDKMTIKDVASSKGMFLNYPNTSLSDLPTIQLGKVNNSFYRLRSSQMFSGATKLKDFPPIGTPDEAPIYLEDATYMFENCYSMTELPEWVLQLTAAPNEMKNTVQMPSADYMFKGCYSLRSIPTEFLSQLKCVYEANSTTSVSRNGSSILASGFYQCYSLDELVGVPMPDGSTTTTKHSYSISSSQTFQRCSRLKRLTFMGAIYKSPVIDLTQGVGYFISSSDKTNMLKYNSGITADKEVTDAATYEALKNDPDWFSMNIAYSRYNHDSAVETLESLPDLTPNSFTGTIKFKKNSGSATDGGAISALTTEEIASASAKGWTVTLS